MSAELPLLMISAMYENGGNTTHRLLDGHPELFVYPFESQIGTRLVNDALSAMFPAKYRWPAFAFDASPAADYHAIIDGETKVRARTPQVSKFRHMPFDFSDDERRDHYIRYVTQSGRSTPSNVGALFRATFDAWKSYRRSGLERIYVGYSPAIVVDAVSILAQMPNAHVLHVVRNPWSAYADTKKRPVPLPLASYMLRWSLNQHFALLCKQLVPDRMHIVRIEDVMARPRDALSGVCNALGIAYGPSFEAPSWNGEKLEEVYPWGTIRRATAEANRATAAELSTDEQRAVRLNGGLFLKPFGYDDFLGS
jgi:sulfotransferase family protein